MNFAMKNALIFFALTAGFSHANATVLVADVPTSNVATTPTFFGGTFLDSAITNISNISYNGIARTAVYDTGAGIDFYYQFSNDASSQNGVARFSGFDFSSLGAAAVNVFQTGTGFGIFTNGTEKSEYADRTSAGVIGFNFVPNAESPVNPGLTSFVQIIRTNARDYKAGNFGLLDGIGDNAKGFAPALTTPVPEPETYAMLLSGLGFMGFVARRRRYF